MKAVTINNVKHKGRRVLQRIGLKVTRLFDPSKNRPSQTENQYEKETFGVCHRLIANENTTLLVSPISGKRYIKSDDNQIFIVIQPSVIKIVNHTYSYDIMVDGSNLHDRIVRIFDLEVERRREQMELEIQQNVKHSLKSIYEALNHEQV